MSIYRVNVHRSDRWWIIDVPELDGHVAADGSVNIGAVTQARRYVDIETEARDFIATVVDVAPGSIDLDMHVDVDGFDVSTTADHVRELKEQAERFERQAQDEQADLAAQLSARGVAVRDIGAVLGVSYQRAHQLVSSR